MIIQSSENSLGQKIQDPKFLFCNRLTHCDTTECDFEDNLNGMILHTSLKMEMLKKARQIVGIINRYTI